MSQLSTVYGCAADFTQLDCGRPIIDPDTPSLLKLCKFVRARLTPVYTEGDELSLDDAKGRPIVDQEGCSYLSKYEVEFEFGGIHPSYAAWLTGDRISNTGRGGGFGTREDCPPWFSLRIWQELAGSGRKICVDGEDEELMVHWLPCVTGFRITSDFEMAKDVVTRVTMTATAYPNLGSFLNGHWGEYTYSDLPADPATGAVAGWLPGEEIHAYEPVTDVPLPDCEGQDCLLVPFDGPPPPVGEGGEGGGEAVPSATGNPGAGPVPDKPTGKGSTEKKAA